MDPNISWPRSQLERDVDTGGCCIPGPSPWGEAWYLRNTPLHQALWLENLDAARFLLDAGADINMRNALGRTPVHEAVVFESRETLDFLIQHGADLDALTFDTDAIYHAEGEVRGPRGLLPTHFALLGGNIELMQQLINGGARATSVSLDGWSLLDLAVLCEDRRAVTLLVSQGAKFLEHRTAESSPLSDHKTAASHLLAVATSRRLFPPASLYPVYRLALSQVDVSILSAREPRNTIFSAAERLITNFFTQLRGIAGMKAPVPARGLCHCCSVFLAKIKYANEDEQRNSRHWYQLYEHLDQLLASANNGCPLCTYIAELLDSAELFEEDSEKKPPSDEDGEGAVIACERIYLCVGYSIEVHYHGKWASLCDVRMDESLIPDLDLSSDGAVGTGSKQALATAKMWLENCKLSPQHSKCQIFAQEVQKSAKGQRPTRLLHVGHEEKHPVLIEQVTESMLYVALSYITEQPENTIETTVTNREAHMTGIPIERLPLALKDAIVATRHLGLDYIWINTLCIIQDDAQDYAREISKMHAIYTLAELTLSSLLSNGIDEPLFQSRQARTACPIPIKIWQNKNRRKKWEPGVVYCDVLLCTWLFKDEKRMLRGNLDSQDWAVHEHLLSPRILYFGPQVLHWECLCHYALEPDPAQILSVNLPGERKVRDRQHAKSQLVDAPTAEPDSLPEAFKVWQREVGAFAQKTMPLSKQPNRLAALWGSSKLVEHRLDNASIGGIWWGKYTGASLCWRYKSQITGEFVVPSWTWIETQGHVSFDWLDREGKLVSLTAPVSFDIENNLPTFQVRGSITLKGSLYRVKLQEEWLPKAKFTVTYTFDHKEHAKPEDCYAFDLVAFRRGPIPTGFGLPTWPEGQPPCKIFLLLEKSGQDTFHYRRVGLGKLDFLPRFRSRNYAPFPWIKDEAEYKDVITLI